MIPLAWLDVIKDNLPKLVDEIAIALEEIEAIALSVPGVVEARLAEEFDPARVVIHVEPPNYQSDQISFDTLRSKDTEILLTEYT